MEKEEFMGILKEALYYSYQPHHLKNDPVANAKEQGVIEWFEAIERNLDKIIKEYENLN